MSRASTQREQFLQKRLRLPPQDGWNEAGDEKVWVHMFDPRPPLTLYAGGAAFKTLAVTKSGRVPRAEFDQIAGWIAAGALPDGTSIEQMGLIVPSREAALAVARKAVAIGVSRIAYTDKEGTLWNPFPAGEWLEVSPRRRR